MTPMLDRAQVTAWRTANSTFSTFSSGPESITRAGGPARGAIFGRQASSSKSPLEANAQSSAKASVKLRNDWAFDAEMQILHRRLRVCCHNVLVGEVHAAGEACRAVDDQDLLVVTQVDERHPPGE